MLENIIRGVTTFGRHLRGQKFREPTKVKEITRENCVGVQVNDGTHNFAKGGPWAHSTLVEIGACQIIQIAWFSAFSLATIIHKLEFDPKVELIACSIIYHVLFMHYVIFNAQRWHEMIITVGSLLQMKKRERGEIIGPKSTVEQGNSRQSDWKILHSQLLNLCSSAPNI